jgi:hypothetical protein
MTLKKFISQNITVKDKFLIKLNSTLSYFKKTYNDYNDISKYDETKKNKFIPLFGWIEIREYKKKN